jgi:GPH family glycoside/pentoside/hexuronide:cation symporter
MEKTTEKVPFKLKFGYALGEISDSVAYQGFSFLIFTFYYTVIGLSVTNISIAFIIWSIYNSLNDPVLGAISDRMKTTKLGGGRRRPWIIGMTGPLALMMIFLFTPPANNPVLQTLYFLFAMCLFDTVYTGYSLNNTSLYPEMFGTNRSREEVGAARRILMVVGLILAFILPGFVIRDMTNVHGYAETPGQYILTGAIFAVIIVGINIWHIKWGVREPPLEAIRSSESLGFFESLKITLTNKHFLFICSASIMNWYVFGILPMIVPIYATHVLGLDRSSLEISILLLVAFLGSIPGVLLWSKIDAKVGSKNAFIISTLWWLLSFIPFIFLRTYTAALVAFILVGIELGGAPYFLDRNISNVIDEDELKTKQRREAAYYGVHALIIRLSTILIILTVSIVLSTNGWQTYNPEQTTPELLNGLVSLMSYFPMAALAISLIFLGLFPLTKARVDTILAQKVQR